MNKKKREIFYLMAISLLLVFFASAVVMVYRYMTDHLVVSGAASDWVSVDFSDISVINSNETTAFWDPSLAYVEAARDNSSMSRVVYSEDVHYGGTLAVSPDFSNDHIMMSCSYYGCYKTANAGSSWSLSLDDYAILSVEMSPDFANDQTIVALGFYGIYLSTDAGQSWNKRDNSLSAYLGSVEFSPDFANDGTIYSTSFGGGLYESTDSGLTWNAIAAFPDSYPIDVVLSPDFVNDDTLWVTTEANGVYKSTDRGANWASVNNGLADLSVGTIAVSPDFVNDDTLFLTAIDNQHRLYKSTDAGANWVDLGAGISNDLSKVLWKVFVSPDFANDSRVIVADYTGRKSWYSDDAGASWTESNLESVIGAQRAVNKMEPDASIVASSDYLLDETLWMVSLNENGFLKSVDGGKTWVKQSLDDNGYFTASSAEVHYAPDYSDSREIWALDFYLGPSVSTDGGKTWLAKNSGLEKNSLTINYDDFYLEDMFLSSNYANDNTLFVAYASYYNTDKFLYKSTDRGDTWALVNFPVSVYNWNYRMAFSPDYINDNTILFGIGWEGLFKSTNNGDTWVAVPAFPADRINDIDFGVDVNEYIVAGYNNSLYYTDDAGVSFTSHDINGAGISDIVLDSNYESNGIFYSLSYNNEFAEISDKGTSFTVKKNGLPTNLADYGGRHVFLSENYLSDGKAFITGLEDASGHTGAWPYDLTAQKAYYYQTVDGASNWTQINYDFIHSILAIEGHAMSPNYAEDNEQWIATMQEGLYKNYVYETGQSRVQSNLLKETDRAISKVRLVVTESNSSAGTISYYVSTDGGNHWTYTPKNQEVRITDHPGNKLLWRALIESNEIESSPRIESVQIFYETAAGSTPPIYSSSSPTINTSIDVGDYGESDFNLVDIEIYNERYDEVIMSNHEDLLADSLNKDSGEWINFGFENTYENWVLEDIDNAKVYMRFRRLGQAAYDYSEILVIPAEDISNSRQLSSEVKSYIEGQGTMLNTVTQGFGLVQDYPEKVRYTCDYDYEKFKVIPYLHNSAGEWFAGELKEGSLTSYEFPAIDFATEITLKLVAENTYEIIINYLEREAHFELYLRQYYDDLVVHEDFVLADTWLMYQKAKEKEILMVDLCHFLRVYKNNNYLELYSQPNYQGFKQTVYSNVDDFSHEFIGDNNIASVKIFGDLKIAAYSDAAYKGKKFEFTGNINNFNGTSLGNDNISSLKLIYIEKKEEIRVAKGSPFYLEASENSRILDKAEEPNVYEVIWSDGDWYKVKLDKNREAWFLNKN